MRIAEETRAELMARLIGERKMIFSPDRKYRYTLFRKIDEPLLETPGRFCQFIGLNPSTADEVKDDATIRRCMDYTKRWGFQEYCMTNLFAYRSTDPLVLKRLSCPDGASNVDWIVACAKLAGLVVAAWGCHGKLNDQDMIVLTALREVEIDVHCLKLTKQGHPQHPLYLKASLKPVVFGRPVNSA